MITTRTPFVGFPNFVCEQCGMHAPSMGYPSTYYYEGEMCVTVACTNSRCTKNGALYRIPAQPIQGVKLAEI